MTPGGMTPGGMTPGGMAPGGMAHGGMAHGGVPPGGMAQGGGARAVAGGAPMIATAEPTVTPVPAEPQLANFRDVVALAGTRREAMLHAHLLHSTHLVRFAPPVIEPVASDTDANVLAIPGQPATGASPAPAPAKPRPRPAKPPATANATTSAPPAATTPAPVQPPVRDPALDAYPDQVAPAQ